MTAPLSALELASGIVTGGGYTRRLTRVTIAPGELLRAAVTPALRGGRCFVSFSGGIDSSLVLSAATQAARREGLPDPIPLTWRFADAPAAEESRWQEQVVAELGLDDWVRLTAETGEVDLVGPLAGRVLTRHGVLQPANAFLHVPLLERARDGTLLTGVGGDQVLGLWRWRAAAAVLRREWPLRPRTALTVALSRSPVAVRARLERRDATAHAPWLWPDSDRAVRSGYAREVASEPPTWPDRVAWQASRRHLALGLQSLDRLAADAGASIAHPLLDPDFLSGLATAGGRYGVGSRAATIAALLGDVLPVALQNRRTKAHFDEVFWQTPARELMRRWDGEGVDREIVDVVALRSLWREAPLHPRTAHLLQQVWLAAHPPPARRARRTDPVDGPQRAEGPVQPTRPRAVSPSSWSSSSEAPSADH